MKLSIVIVNYNVKFFLEQCLISVQKAAHGMDVETWVVDNNSVDGSMSMVREKFPWVQCIENTRNVGFSQANNQAIRQATGEYILLLNPDTVLEEDTLRLSVDFMDAHSDAGGLGVKMVDGTGRFLKESKRSLPTPSVAFFKIFGLSSLFPKSRIFARYHLGYLDKDRTHVVDILAGAYMMLRKSALDKTGLLDEHFFMYGEDIDLSYRLTKAGYRNYYFPGTRIIHYKGESTKKSSVNYVLVFYRAMVIFARKHFSPKNAHLFSILINSAIYLRATAAIAVRFMKAMARPTLDFTAGLAGLWLLSIGYGTYIQFPDGGDYPPFFREVMLPVYALIWLLALKFNGGYRKPVSLSRVFRGIATGTLFILAVYALLDKSLQVSRAMILLGAVWLFLVVCTRNLLTSFFNGHGLVLAPVEKRNILIVGDATEASRVRDLLNLSPSFIRILGFVHPGEGKKEDPTGLYLGGLNQLKEMVIVYKADEVIFCSEDISAHTIIDTMTHLENVEVNFRIAPPEALFIIGSQSIEAPRDLYVIDVNSIARAFNRRNKRLADIVSALVLLVLTPVTFFIVKGPAGFLQNIFRVLSGKKTWVGYHPLNARMEHLPKLKPGVLSPSDGLSDTELRPDTIDELNIHYARDYRIRHDLAIIWKGFPNLGRQ